MERNGLTILDLVKYAARIALENLDDNDRLGIVIFSNEAEVLQLLLPMTQKNKKVARDRIEGIVATSGTSLWYSILQGRELISQSLQRTPVVMVFSDGVPTW
jgi:Mg-chelatase subunit ChlD